VADGDKKPAVRLEHVTKSFENRKVLDDVSIDVAHGEAFCLLGRSGTGKSVTLKLMIGLIAPDQGRVYVDGEEIRTLDPGRLSNTRKKIGFLFQSAALFDSISVGDNVAFPLRRHTNKSRDEVRSIVQEKLKDVELEKEAGKMPSDLSGGMRKRAALARALVLNPSILLVDEPSSGLDSITATEIYDLLLSLKKKHDVTLICVTHDAAGTRKFADRFGVLDNGKIVGSGSAEELERSRNPLVRDLATGAET
jgi:phospholipid/cholesterol/gamma-HCH transport system ATP-binding protein